MGVPNMGGKHRDGPLCGIEAEGKVLPAAELKKLKERIRRRERSHVSGSDRKSANKRRLLPFKKFSSLDTVIVTFHHIK
jgi:hypothetical protein